MVIMLVNDEAIQFYKNTIARSEIDSTGKKIFQVERWEFNFGAVLALCNLIQKIALLVFNGIGVAFTCGQKPSFRSSVKENFNDSLKYLSAITIGCVGILFPDTVNREILQIPKSGLVLA